MKVEIYYCDICKKEVGHNEDKLYNLVMEVPTAWSYRSEHYQACPDCINKIEKLIDSIKKDAK